MLQDSQMTRNTGRIITRLLYFHLLIKRCVFIATFYQFPVMGLFLVVIFQFLCAIREVKMARLFSILYNDGLLDG